MTQKIRRFIFILGSFLPLLILAASINPVDLKCEYLKNPTVIDVLQPRLSWVNQANKGQKGVSQKAYEIQVASDKELLLQSKADLWKTRKRKSSDSYLIKYEGKALESGMDCWWRVRVWDNKRKTSAWSEPAYWHVGLLNETDWQAEWIGAPWQGEQAMPYNSVDLPHPAPLLRKSFELQKPIHSAKIYTTGLGYFELYCNGEKVGDDVLTPNQTQWTKRENLETYRVPVHDNFEEYRVLYLSYDLKPLLKQGQNAIGAILGNGFYNAAYPWVMGYGTPRFLAQLEIVYEDGEKELITSDTSWKIEKGPIVYDMIYQGEHYDARLEYPDWCQPDYDDSNWLNAIEREAPEGRLQAQMSPSDKVMEVLKPVDIQKLEGKGNYKIDFGEEISGWVKLQNVNGKRGHRIRIKYLSESYNGDNSYTLKGSGNENYATRFTWYVFREVEVYGWPEELSAGQITAEAVYTAVDVDAEFECSNGLFNTIQKIWRRSQTDNMHGGIASDCPHRERLAYTGDGQVVMKTVLHNYDVAAFYREWIEDIVGAQNKTTGYVPNSAPAQPGAGGGVPWGAAICTMPWDFYQAYADKDMLAYSYDGMKKYIAYMQKWVDERGIMHQQAHSKEELNYWLNLGDWSMPGEFPPDDMVHTFYLWMCAKNTAETAMILGNKTDAEFYHNLAQKTKMAFQNVYYDNEEGTFGNYGANIFALEMGLEGEIKERVIAAVDKNIDLLDGHLDTGIYGTKFLFEQLCAIGLNEQAYRIMNKTTFPSFGHWIAQGATTTWEQWDGVHSRNHPMFGGGLTWFYRDLAGMRAADPGYKKIIFKASPPKDLTHASYYKQTPYGKAGIAWEKKGGQFLMKVVVPVGSEATVYVPSNQQPKINKKDKQLQFLSFEDGYATYKVKSGEYGFVGDL